MAKGLWNCTISPRSGFRPPQPPEPFGSFAINVLSQHGILGGVGGPAARQSVKEKLCNLCNLWFDENSCSFVSIRGS